MRAASVAFRSGAVLLVAALLAACGAARPAPAPLTPQAQKEAEIQREFAVESYYERVERLNAIAYRLVRANEPLCRQRSKAHMTLGLTAEFFTRQGNRIWFEAQSKRWGVSENTIVVTSVMPGGPAEAAGIQKGDILEAVNGKMFRMVSPRGDMTRTLDDFAGRGGVLLQMRRAGQRRLVSIAVPAEVCDSRFTTVVGDALNAYADGRSVFATYGIMNLFQKDEDLAVVLGHEMAHNILGHVRQDASGKAVGTTTPEQEAEADAVGLYFAARAGYAIKDAPSVWRRLAAQNPAYISAGRDHPSTAERFLGLEAVRDEILMRQAAGLPLIPRPRVAPGE